MGAAFSIKDVSVALTPTITLGTSNVESQSVNIRAGYRALSEWHGEVWGVRVQTVRRVNSPFQFTREDSMQLRMRVTKQANLGIEFGRIPQLERSFQRFLISYAL